MNASSVATWFFESLSHQYPDKLVIKLVEGIKSKEREMVEIHTGQSLGPYFSVKVLEESRCIFVEFDGVLSYQVVSESISAPQIKRESTMFDSPVEKCSSLEYQKYIESDSIIKSVNEGEYSSYFIWCEDQTFFVISTQSPKITWSDEKPDLSIERYATWFSS